VGRAVLLKPSLPTLVVQGSFLVAVRGSVEFDDEARRKTGEVGHIGSDWHLSSKVRSGER
jgi:hypothetical protein